MEKQVNIQVGDKVANLATEIKYSVDPAENEVITFNLVAKTEASDETSEYSEELARDRYFVLGSDNQDFELTEEEIEELKNPPVVVEPV